MPPLVVGFDLDMTLIDSRAGFAATLDVLAAETGTVIDSGAAAARLGPPLETELARWFLTDQVPAMGDRFRAIYPDVAIAPTIALPGARQALDAVRRAGGRSVIVTAKFEANARLHLAHLGLAVDDVIGWHWGPKKGEALRRHRASIYVGDHVADIQGARAAGAVSVAVATGPASAAELDQAGADVVLTTLAEFPGWLDRHLTADDGAGDILASRLRQLDRQLQSLGSVVVAFSGGADSAFLLAAAVRALGADQVVAATAVSDSLPVAELAAARAVAADLGVRHVTPRTAEMQRAGYRANSGDRCYFCKAELLDVLAPIAAEHGLRHIVTGTNADDALAGFRPGIRAAHERGARTPLRDSGLTKVQVRAASRALGLSTWDKPAAACLSSRIAFGIEVSPQRLARIELAEARLRTALGTAGISVRDLRVRDLGSVAQVEIDAAQVPRLAGSPDLESVLAAVCSAGFPAAELDPRGFRSGAMNELLDDPGAFR